ncbi:hypothetical protein L0152_29300 [bacterium]|nr:hypothetical protein [bacterium]
MSTYKEILDAIAVLDAEDQQKVLDYARGLTKQPSPPNALLRFAGSISKEDLQRMSNAITEGCETVDVDEW